MTGETFMVDIPSSVSLSSELTNESFCRWLDAEEEMYRRISVKRWWWRGGI